jgi:hypothetical protein
MRSHPLRTTWFATALAAFCCRCEALGVRVVRQGGLGKADEVGVVGVHVGQLNVDDELDVVLGLGLNVADERLNVALRLLAQPGVCEHSVNRHAEEGGRVMARRETHLGKRLMESVIWLIISESSPATRSTHFRQGNWSIRAEQGMDLLFGRGGRRGGG